MWVSFGTPMTLSFPPGTCKFSCVDCGSHITVPNSFVASYSESLHHIMIPPAFTRTKCKSKRLGTCWNTLGNSLLTVKPSGHAGSGRRPQRTHFCASLLQPDALEVAAGPGEHIFVRHYFRLDAVEVATGPAKHIVARYIFRPEALEVTADPGEHIFMRHFLRPDALEVAAGPGEHIFARHVLHADALKVATGPSEHIFARHALHADALKVATGPSEHIFARHFLRPDALEVPPAPANTFLRVTFCMWTR